MRRDIERPGRERERHEPRERYEFRERMIDRLPTEDVRTLRTIGTFRVVDPRDLDRDVKPLLAEGLIERRRYVAGNRKVLEAVFLTRDGYDLIDRNRSGQDNQRYHIAEINPRELEHDLAIYRAYKQEAGQVERERGTVKRVVLDPEFREQGRAKMPDARIEYRDGRGREQHRDLEIRSRGKSASANASSGSSVYSKSGSGSNRYSIKSGQGNRERCLDHYWIQRL
jgi:hypothetical protein